MEEVKGSPGESNQMCLAFEKRLFDKRKDHVGRLRCTLVTGFLGSGKSTLVRHILDQRGDLRIAVLVNEFGDVDVDSLLLSSSRTNAAFDLSSVSLVNGCACCSIRGDFKEAVQKVLSSKHNFDYLLLETSGLADPAKITKHLLEMGVQLDVIVTVVDVEALHKILEVTVARQQLTVADIVLINKCDLASFGAISDVEDLVEKETGGTKAIRCRFCKVPLDLVVDITVSEPSPPITTIAANNAEGFLSHEAVSMASSIRTGDQRNFLHGPGGNHKEDAHDGEQEILKSARRLRRMEAACSMSFDHSDESPSSITFSSNTPLFMSKIQTILTKHMHRMKGLLRAKGFLWFEGYRCTRFVFHWSGLKRAEVMHGGPWESPPSTRVVFIGMDKQELGILLQLFSNAIIGQQRIKMSSLDFSQNVSGGYAKRFAQAVASDSRFKVREWSTEDQQVVLCGEADPFVVFGLVGSPLRGVHDADLNGALMRMVNARGVVFLTAVTSSKEDQMLQLAFNDEQPSQEIILNEITTMATVVRARIFKDIHPCRCDLAHHKH